MEKGNRLVMVVPKSFFVNSKFMFPKKSSNINITKAVFHEMKPDEKNWYIIDDYKFVSKYYGVFKKYELWYLYYL